MSGAGGCVAPPSRAGWPGAWGSDPAPLVSTPGGASRARGAHGGGWRWWRAAPRRLFLARSPRRPKDGPRDGVREVPGPAPRGFGTLWRRGLAGFGRGVRRRLGVSGKVRAGPGGGRVRTRPDARPWVPQGPFISPGSSERALRSVSPRSFRLGSAGGSGGRPLSSSSAERQVASVALNRLRRWLRPRLRAEVGEGVGALGLRPVEPRRDGVGWSLQGLLVVVEGLRAPLKRTCTLNSPSSPFPWPQKRPPLDRSSPPAQCGTLRQLFAAGRASQQELCCAGVACRGVCQVSLKNNLWRPQRSLSAHSLF